MADDDTLLLNISLSDSDDAPEPNSPTKQAEAAGKGKRDKNFQSEADFLKIKADYHIKIENGEIWRTIKPPASDKASKPENQEVLHAAEELYFFKRYDECAKFIHGINSSKEFTGLDHETLGLLKQYLVRCETRLASER